MWPYTTENIESGRRQPLLSFSHHIEVASLTPDKQELFLKNRPVLMLVVELLFKIGH
jgi:hypothetical protein